MMWALFLLAQTQGLGVQTSPGGAEVLLQTTSGPAWTETRLALRTPEDPPERAGLGAVVGQVILQELGAMAELGATAEVRRSPRGIIISYGIPTARADATLEAVLTRLMNLKLSEARLKAAISEAVYERQDLRRDPVELAHLELQRSLLGRDPVQGQIADLVSVSRAEVTTFLRAVLVQSRLSLICAGDVQGLDPQSSLALLPTRTSSEAASVSPPDPTGRPLEIIVVDQPGVQRAFVQLGWRPAAVRSEATRTVAAALLGPGASWLSPTMNLARTATVGAEAATLGAMLSALESAARRGSQDGVWRAAVATATRAVALQLRDPARTADSLAWDRVDASRTLRPVLSARIADLRSPPEDLAGHYQLRRPVAVVVTTLRPDLVAQLAALVPGATVHVHAWDQR